MLFLLGYPAFIAVSFDMITSHDIIRSHDAVPLMLDLLTALTTTLPLATMQWFKAVQLTAVDILLNWKDVSPHRIFLKITLAPIQLFHH